MRVPRLLTSLADISDQSIRYIFARGWPCRNIDEPRAVCSEVRLELATSWSGLPDNDRRHFFNILYNPFWMIQIRQLPGFRLQNQTPYSTNGAQ